MKKIFIFLLTAKLIFAMCFLFSCAQESGQNRAAIKNDYRGIPKAQRNNAPLKNKPIAEEEPPQFIDQVVYDETVADIEIQRTATPPPPPNAPVVEEIFKVVKKKYIHEDALDIPENIVIEPVEPTHREQYNETVENAWADATEAPVSTFSIDADGGSFANVRRFLEDGQMPPIDAVRTEELINYFQYDYPEPKGDHPIALDGEITSCPWADGHKILRIGLKGKHVQTKKLPNANFVFLIDVSGSMSASNKLGLLKESFTMFADNLRPNDRIAIVTYASSAGVLLNSTTGRNKAKIKRAIAQLGAGGSTNGAGGIIEAYEIAQSHFIRNGNNRVILGTDGDFNVGVSSQDGLLKLIEEKRETGIFLSVLGVGTGNYQEGKMEQLANHGNGTYEYLDDSEQARKVFVEDLGKFYNVAKDVKIQLKFNPELVESYRLIGYENRILNEEDFLDDTKDAGEMGINQSVTALYELIPAARPAADASMLTVDFRYKFSDARKSRPLKLDIFDRNTPFQAASENTRFATAVAGYGLMLRDSEYKGNLTWDKVWDWSVNAQRFDPNGHRGAFLPLIKRAKKLDNVQ